MDLLLVGNANTGKTTLFNRLTKSREKVGNWDGVTVECKRKTLCFDNKKLTVVDLPGIDSIVPKSKDEVVAVEELKNRKKQNCKVCVVCDAAAIGKSLMLAVELQKAGIDFDVAINMINEVEGDTDMLQKEIEKLFACKCFLIDARKKKCAKQMLDYYVNCDNVKSDANAKKAENLSQSVANIAKNCKIEIRKMEKLEKLFASKLFVLLAFVALFALIFWLAFGTVGNFLSVMVEKVFVDGLFDYVVCKAYAVGEILGLFCEQVLYFGVGSVVCFVPQILILYACISILENAGIVARFSLVFDSFFRRLGLSGRSAFSLLAGFGCTTSAVLVSRNIGNLKTRKKTIAALPFFGCSAKIPVLLVVCSLFFEKCKFLCVLGVYLLSFFVFLLVFLILSLFDKKEEDGFFVRLPRLRSPSFGVVANSVAANFVEFFRRTFFSVLVLCSVLFLLGNFDFSLCFVGVKGGRSMLRVVGEFFAPVFLPLGFGSWGVVVALLFGLVAKEMIVSALALVNGAVAGGLAISLVDNFAVVHFSILSSASFLVFIMLFTPCIPSLQMMRKEIGFWFSCFVGVFQFVVAYVVSMFVYQIGLGNLIFVWILIALAVALLCLFVVKCKRKGDCCCGCYNKNCFRRKSNKAV